MSNGGISRQELSDGLNGELDMIKGSIESGAIVSTDGKKYKPVIVNREGVVGEASVYANVLDNFSSTTFHTKGDYLYYYDGANQNLMKKHIHTREIELLVENVTFRNRSFGQYCLTANNGSYTILYDAKTDVSTVCSVLSSTATRKHYIFNGIVFEIGGFSNTVSDYITLKKLDNTGISQINALARAQGRSPSITQLTAVGELNFFEADNKLFIILNGNATAQKFIFVFSADGTFLTVIFLNSASNIQNISADSTHLYCIVDDGTLQYVRYYSINLSSLTFTVENQVAHRLSFNPGYRFFTIGDYLCIGSLTTTSSSGTVFTLFFTKPIKSNGIMTINKMDMFDNPNGHIQLGTDSPAGSSYIGMGNRLFLYHSQSKRCYILGKRDEIIGYKEVVE